jgi:hypothetical protein
MRLSPARLCNETATVNQFVTCSDYTNFHSTSRALKKTLKIITLCARGRARSGPVERCQLAAWDAVIAPFGVSVVS